jgi:hypothetical protein
LIQLVPPERRSEKFPCQHIPLNALGETLDSLYRYCDQQEVEETVRSWLRATIGQLEEERRPHHHIRARSIIGFVKAALLSLFSCTKKNTDY